MNVLIGAAGLSRDAPDYSETVVTMQSLASARRLAALRPPSRS